MRRQEWLSRSSPSVIQRVHEMLAASEIGLVVDVRTVPRSRTNPQYNRKALPASLSASQIAYEHIDELGCPPDAGFGDPSTED